MNQPRWLPSFDQIGWLKRDLSQRHILIIVSPSETVRADYNMNPESGKK